MGLVARLQAMWFSLAVIIVVVLCLISFVSVSICDNGKICVGFVTSNEANMVEKFRKFAVGSLLGGVANNTSLSLNQSDVDLNVPDPDKQEQEVEPVGPLPGCLIIGVRKGGTRAVQHFMSLHPQIVILGPEVNFFSDEKYPLGLSWYSKQMPPVGPGQVLIEKTADYFQNHVVPERVRRMNSTIKLILVVRDPVERLISDYYFLRRYAMRNNITNYVFLETRYTLEELLVNSTTKKVQYSHGGLYRSKYSMFFKSWLKFFPREQFYIVNGDSFSKRNPALELQKIEKFLHLPPHAAVEDYYYDSRKGFWCLATTGCLGDEKGHIYPPLDQAVETAIRNFFRPFNEEFYNLSGINFGWK